jgi:hypothetical protein
MYRGKGLFHLRMQEVLMNSFKTMVLMVTLTLMLVFVGAALGGKNGMPIPQHHICL